LIHRLRLIALIAANAPSACRLSAAAADPSVVDHLDLQRRPLRPAERSPSLPFDDEPHALVRPADAMSIATDATRNGRARDLGPVARTP